MRRRSSARLGRPGLAWLILSSAAALVACSGASPGAPADAAADVGVDAAADCTVLYDELVTAFEQAVDCDPASTTPQCTGATFARNQCGCEWAVNDQTPDEAAAALQAWDTFMDQGCQVPPGCGACPTPTPAFRCVMLPIGTLGTCEIDPG